MCRFSAEQWLHLIKYSYSSGTLTVAQLLLSEYSILNLLFSVDWGIFLFHSNAGSMYGLPNREGEAVAMLPYALNAG